MENELSTNPFRLYRESSCSISQYVNVSICSNNLSTKIVTKTLLVYMGHEPHILGPYEFF